MRPMPGMVGLIVSNTKVCILLQYNLGLIFWKFCCFSILGVAPLWRRGMYVQLFLVNIEDLLILLFNVFLDA